MCAQSRGVDPRRVSSSRERRDAVSHPGETPPLCDFPETNGAVGSVGRGGWDARAPGGTTMMSCDMVGGRAIVRAIIAVDARSPGRTLLSPPSVGKTVDSSRFSSRGTVRCTSPDRRWCKSVSHNTVSRVRYTHASRWLQLTR